MSTTKIPEPWNTFFEEIDRRINRKACLHCMGGFVVTTLWGAPRKTGDVDVLTIQPGNEHKPILDMAGKGSELHHRHKLYIDYVSMCTYPEDYAQRLREIFPGALKYLQLFALDPYDIALTKLERNSQRDRDDVMYLARTVPFDLGILVDRYNSEMRPYLSGEDRHDRTLRLWVEAIEEERNRGHSHTR
jgi:Nucleotidyltransferase of unknown function (DUF6036)